MRAKMCRFASDAQEAFQCAFEVVSEAPTVDAVEVVRCKDCKHLKRVGHVGGFCMVEGICRIRGNEDFCSRGEKMGGDSDD